MKTVEYIGSIAGSDKKLRKNVNYKLFSFCISFMSQNMKNSNIKSEFKFINRIVDNGNLQDAIIDLPKLNITRKIYVIAIKQKNVILLYILSLIKHIFIDSQRG